SYGYRPGGYVTDIHDHLSGTRRFDLDPVGRITEVHGVGWTERYAYDQAGNITDAAWPTPQADSTVGDPRGEREYAGTLLRRAGNVRYQYDAQGRITLRQQKRLSAKPRTWHYTWDADDRLVAVTTPDGQHWRYHYDPFGRRTAKQRLGTDGSGVAEQVDFTWDGVVLAEQTHTGGPDDPGRNTVWDWEPDSFRPLGQTERTALHDAPQEWVDEQFYAIVTDLVGTTTEMVGPDGNLAWHPRATLWGTVVDGSTDGASCPLRFPGQYFDPETQLSYNYHRYYDSATGGYYASDPLGLAGGSNPHRYVSNPLGWMDPLGLVPCRPRFKSNRRQSRSYGRSVADIRGQANGYAERMSRQGYDVNVGALRIGRYGEGRGDITVAVYKKGSDEIVHIRHFITKHRIR
ncbi:MAG: RHS repeat-associated core domain-containing protein, partial [Actinobacteria bacterium]|nr:RHS repeat-associated core domain-containing protein [Actinomycetota bacterium]